MNKNLFEGQLVRLTVENPEAVADLHARWARNSTFMRLLDDQPTHLWSAKKIKEWHEKEADKQKEGRYFSFAIRALADDRLIGFVDIWVNSWSHGDGWVGIGIGEPEYWGNGYGTDAMQTFLRYAFLELNLHRVSLGVFSYNPRAIRSYEKAGFVLEGRERQAIHRDGNRQDALIMGILREEWFARNM